MARKIQLITELYGQALDEIKRSAGAWRAFLRCAGYNYRCRFDEQVLIFAQRPDATAVLPIEKWNHLFGRWVNQGATGIAVFDDSSPGKSRLAHYFDISDTHESRDARPVPLWEIQEQHTQDVIETFGNAFGLEEETLDLSQAILATAQNVVMDNSQDYVQELMYARQGSFLEDLDEQNLTLQFRTALESSLSYMLLARCLGDASKDYVEDLDFSTFTSFSTRESVTVLGVATSDMAEMVLREVATTVRSHQRAEQKALRTIDDSIKPHYPVNEQAEFENERSIEDGTELQRSGRLQSPRPSTTPGGTNDSREVCTTTTPVLEGTSEGNLYQPIDHGQAEYPSDGDPGDSLEQVRAADQGTGQTRGLDRRPQVEGSNEMGWPDEQHQALSRGDHSKGIDHELSPRKAEPPDVDSESQPEIEPQAESQLELSAFFDGSLTQTSLPNDNVEQETIPTSPEINLDDQLEIDGRRYRIDDINRERQTVSLQDITFKQSTGFPIFRRESIAYLREVMLAQMNKTKDSLEAREETTDKTTPQTTPIQRPTSFSRFHPEVPGEERHDFKITNPKLGHGKIKERYEANIKAIRLLKEIEDEDRLATPQEQEILSGYVGWGGLAGYFEEDHQNYGELRNLLDDDEYVSARESTLTAFYTSPTIIHAMYKALAQMGFDQGNILEPSCGTGNFIGMKPSVMAGANVYGVELDSVSGRLARQLYQNSSIVINGFESVEIPDSFFDVAIGNVPFGDFKVLDKRYDKHKWLIHDYFFGKSLDKVRPGGIIAFITSKGTLDKENGKVRKYLAQRADLIGALRLPNNAFLDNAGTKVTADIIFLQKRDRMLDIEPDWVHLDKNENGIAMNSYFVEHPEMILGEMVMESGPFGMTSTCKPYDDTDLSEQLEEAITGLHARVNDYELDMLTEDEDLSIPADPAVRNFSYTLVNDRLFFRENSRMHPVETSVTAHNRIKGLIALRDCARTLIESQTEDFTDDAIREQQERLGALYDNYTKKYERLNSRGNSLAFGEDASYPLLCSLEILDEEGRFLRKADMFNKRTIKPHIAVTTVDTASEALAVSISEKACVDMAYMGRLSGQSEDALESELRGIIFRDIVCPTDPAEISTRFLDLGHYPLVTSDEYLSGNVRKKLQMLKALREVLPAEEKAKTQKSLEALEAAQPKDLSASEISVRIGATWIPPNIYKQYMFELFDTGINGRRNMNILYSKHTAEWNISAKTADHGNIKAVTTYGTKRISAYHIFEQTLNLKDVRIFDTIQEDGKEKRVLNKRETAIAQDRQELIKSKFSEWLWKDINRRERLCEIYNETFNATRPREFDGKHISFPGMNPEISFRPHQINAIARGLYGGNCLLAHCVGAGKTYEMISIAMESKRLGLCSKSLIVVPNHITEQWAGEWLQLYPSANILVATKKDFEKQRRKKFCARIATGDYDAVIIGHSQFEKIPMSKERQQLILKRQVEELIQGIREAKSERADRFTIKQMERSKKSLENKLVKLNDQSRKDDVVTFEELGVDKIFIDESHNFKNLFLVTKMRNVRGIAQSEAQKSSDLFMKTQYLDEITGHKGVVFATGTPISNSMVELYTLHRYLQYGMLQEMSLQHFDAWASTFGETVTAIELSPEGTGYRAKTRFAKFYNLPELMAFFKEVADIQTADMLKLPVPKANFHTEVIKPSELQKKTVESLADRAEAIRAGRVDPTIDNMLKITNDGRKLALDMRLINPLTPDEEESKVSVCTRNIYRIWHETKEDRSTQLVFCDLSTPKNDGTFNVYDDIKEKLNQKGIPDEEIAYIHTANTEAKKKALFAKVRCGQVRVLLGSTQKMGAGTNVQDILIALHDLDCPWRPSDLEQRLGRIVRQGNANPEVEIFRYVTEGTFDSYLYQLVENKQKFISQVMTSKTSLRAAEDIDESALNYAEIKALATGNPLIIEKCNLDVEIGKLNMLKANHLSQRYSLEDMVIRKYPQSIARLQERLEGYTRDMETLAGNPRAPDLFPTMTINGIVHTKKESAGKALIHACKNYKGLDAVILGQYRGFSMSLSYNPASSNYEVTLRGKLSHKVALGTDIHGNITRIDNLLEGMEGRSSRLEDELENTKNQLENAKIELAAPFPKEDELLEKTARLNELNALLNMDQKDHSLVDKEPEEAHVERLERVCERA